MARLRFDNQTGVLGATLTAGATSATLAAPWTAATVVGPDFVAIELEPPTAGVRSPSYEVVYATPVSGSATLTITARGQEGTTAVQHNVGAVWSNGATSVDFVPVVASVAGKTGAVTLVEGDVGNLVTDLAAKVALATVTTKGDLIVATASAAVARLGIGTDGQVLTADSTQTTGAKWATPNVPGFATPAIALGTAAAAGVATTAIRSDATIIVFDATVPVTQNFSDAAATGSAAVAARRDHVHGMPAAPSVTFPLTSAGDETFQPNGIATNALTLHNGAGAVTGVKITGTPSGTAPQLQPTGNTSLIVGNDGGNVFIGPGSQGLLSCQFLVSNAGNPIHMQPHGVANDALLIDNFTSAVNGVQITGTAAGTAPSLAPIGSDANVGLTINSKGSGNIVLSVNGNLNGLTINGATGAITTVNGQILDDGLTNMRVGGTLSGFSTFAVVTTTAGGSVVLGGNASLVAGQAALTATGVAAGVNGITVSQTATGVSPSIAATGSDVNLDVVLVTKGTGVVDFRYADQLTVGAAGAASALPAQPSKYVKIKSNGVLYVVPAYLAA